MDRLLADAKEALSRQKCWRAAGRYYWLTMRYVHYCPAFAAQLYRSAGGVVEPELFLQTARHPHDGNSLRKIMRKWLALLLFPDGSGAAGEAADSGWVNPYPPGVSASSSPLSARQPVSGVMTLVARAGGTEWPDPAGLRVRLCSQSRCVELLMVVRECTTHGFAYVPAVEPSALSGKSSAAADLSRR